MSFGGSPPPPPAVAAVPNEANVEVQRAMDEARQRNKRKRGYSSTILTDTGTETTLGATGKLA